MLEPPQLDLNTIRHRFLLAASFLVVIAFLGFSAVGGYQAYHFSDSVQFCGQTCHEVMRPEFTAYRTSPHARVPCVACHIGPGAEWFVKSKMSGAYQVYSVAFNKFSRPTPTPIHNLRPAQETCEQCHWPAKFWGEQLAVRVHYGSDKANARREASLLIKTGGGAPDGPTHGIHWHMNIANETWYVATDEKRLAIPWVRMKAPSGRVTELVSTEKPITPEERKKYEVRRLDCMDCHSRPSHRYLPPGRALDPSFLAGRSAGTARRVTISWTERKARSSRSLRPRPLPIRGGLAASTRKSCAARATPEVPPSRRRAADATAFKNRAPRWLRCSAKSVISKNSSVSQSRSV